MVRVAVCIDLLHVPSGQHAVYLDALEEDEYGDLSVFLWAEGNFACDCNRHRFFARALGRQEPDAPGCGQGAYGVRLTCAATGEVLYQDDAWRPCGAT